MTIPGTVFPQQQHLHLSLQTLAIRRENWGEDRTTLAHTEVEFPSYCGSVMWASRNVGAHIPVLVAKQITYVENRYSPKSHWVLGVFFVVLVWY
jgi:hypothetical protein